MFDKNVWIKLTVKQNWTHDQKRIQNPVKLLNAFTKNSTLDFLLGSKYAFGGISGVISRYLVILAEKLYGENTSAFLLH